MPAGRSPKEGRGPAVRHLLGRSDIRGPERTMTRVIRLMWLRARRGWAAGRAPLLESAATLALRVRHRQAHEELGSGADGEAKGVLGAAAGVGDCGPVSIEQRRAPPGAVEDAVDVGGLGGIREKVCPSGNSYSGRRK